jgi:hypothetical protein
VRNPRRARRVMERRSGAVRTTPHGVPLPAHERSVRPHGHLAGGGSRPCRARCCASHSRRSERMAT